MLEGDVAGSLDADRLADVHIPVTQLNTDQGFGGECHLDANMVRSALPSLPLADLDLLVIENVGNLVCPAEFRVGEDARVMVSSVTEGEDKPLKYPLMFRACELVIVNKIDLLEHLDFDLEKFLYHLDGVHPGVPHLLVSARTGEGVEEVRDCLVRLATQGGRAGVRPGAATGHESRRSLAERTEANRALLRRRGRPDRAPLPRAWPSASRAAGGCVALGASPAARSDARHVAVEFVHPVIVGKRALPAVGLAGEGGPLAAQVALLAAPDDIVLAFEADDEAPRGRRGGGARLPGDLPAARVGAAERRTRSCARS